MKLVVSSVTYKLFLLVGPANLKHLLCECKCFRRPEKNLLPSFQMHCNVGILVESCSYKHPAGYLDKDTHRLHLVNIH